jgi:flagella basal body P-ring formation protein FlgA
MASPHHLRFRRALGLAFALAGAAGAPAPAQSQVLLTNAEATSEGIFLEQIAANPGGLPLPHLRLGDAPAFGQATILVRPQVLAAVQLAAPALAAATNWSGAERVRVVRLARPLAEAEIREQLTAALQSELVRDKGDLELRLTRPWLPVSIPHELYTVKILDAPASGVSGSFIVRFEIHTPREKFGPWQAPLSAKVWREVWVARSALRREMIFSEADVARDRRDVLGLREPPFAVAQAGAEFEIAENVTAGSPVYARAVRLRPVVQRGQLVDAQVHDGTMMISLRVEVLENGAPGQTVRVRNPQSKREFRGKVKDEQTIIVAL